MRHLFEWAILAENRWALIGRKLTVVPCVTTALRFLCNHGVVDGDRFLYLEWGNSRDRDFPSTTGTKAMPIHHLADPYATPTNYTRVHNSILDRAMPSLSGNGFKVLIVALRQTIGWQDVRSPTGRKQSDAISYSQFMEKGGMSRATAARAIRECIDAGYLLRKPVGRGHVYALNTPAFVPTSSGAESLTSPGPDLPTSPGLEPPTGSGSEHTKGNKENSGGGDTTHILSLLKGFGMNVDQEVRALAVHYSPRQIEHAIGRAGRQGNCNPPGLLRSWMRSGAMPVPLPEEQNHAGNSTDHPELNDDAKAFAAYQAGHTA